MAITFGVVTKVDSGTTTVKTLSAAHTCGVDTKLLIANLHLGTDVVSGTVTVTYGNTPLTLLGARVSATNMVVATYYLANPDIAVLKTITCSWPSNKKLARMAVFDIYGCDPVAPTGFASAGGSGNTASVTVVSNTNSIVVGVMTVGGDDGMTGQAGQTAIYSNLGAWTCSGGCCYETGAASTVVQYTLPNKTWVIQGFSLALDTTPAPTPDVGEESTFLHEDIWMPAKRVVSSDQFYVRDTILGGTLIESFEARLYLGATDKTYGTMVGNTQSFSGNKYVTNKIMNLVGGNIYVLVVIVSIDGKIKTRKCEIHVEKESALP